MPAACLAGSIACMMKCELCSLVLSSLLRLLSLDSLTPWCCCGYTIPCQELVIAPHAALLRDERLPTYAFSFLQRKLPRRTYTPPATSAGSIPLETSLTRHSPGLGVPRRSPWHVRKLFCFRSPVGAPTLVSRAATARTESSDLQFNIIFSKRYLLVSARESRIMAAILIFSQSLRDYVAQA